MAAPYTDVPGDDGRPGIRSDCGRNEGVTPSARCEAQDGIGRPKKRSTVEYSSFTWL